MASPILDAHQQNRLIARLARSGIEYRMRWIWPILGREDRIGGLAMEQVHVQTWDLRFSTHALFLLG
jgi:hypothetical protein